MAAKDRYERTYTCPGCNAKALAQISENDHGFMSGLDRHITIGEPFVVKADTRGNDEAWCGTCGVKAV